MRKPLTKEQIALALHLSSTLTQAEVAERLGVRQYTVSRAIGVKRIMSKTTVTFTVEKGIPVTKVRNSKYNVPPMEIGDSIGIPKSSTLRPVLSAIKGALTSRGEKYSARTQPDGSVRIWRVA